MPGTSADPADRLPCRGNPRRPVSVRTRRWGGSFGGLPGGFVAADQRVPGFGFQVAGVDLVVVAGVLFGDLDGDVAADGFVTLVGADRLLVVERVTAGDGARAGFSGVEPVFHV